MELLIMVGSVKSGVGDFSDEIDYFHEFPKLWGH